MTTAEVLEGMTDPGNYEILAIRALRGLNSDCRAIAHFGVNAQGKTIPNPVDGFCLVPGSNPPKYVMAAFTIVAKDRLARKWLFDRTNAPLAKKSRRAKSAVRAKKATDDDGDLIKAAREAIPLREADRQSTFVVYLCTNRIIDHQLIQLVQMRAKELGVTAEFLDQSQLRDYLDTNPDGQWLRKQHLGIEADQLSLLLLKDLSRLSLLQYGTDLFLLAPDRVMATKAAIAALREFENGTLLFLVGASGSGKSLIARAVLSEALASDGVGIRIPSEVVERATSLPGAIEEVLRSLQPTLAQGSGKVALTLGDANHPLVVVIDDIHRSHNPGRLLEKTVAWARSSMSELGADALSASSCRFICPVWTSLWSAVASQYEELKWIHISAVGSLDRQESINCMRNELGERGTHFTDADLSDFSDQLGDDPFLVGEFGRLLSHDYSTTPAALAEDVVGSMIRQAIGAVSDFRELVPADFGLALDRLAETSIRNKSLYLTLENVQARLQDVPSASAALRRMATQGRICRLTNRAGRDLLEFRHDRILEYFLVRAAGRFLSSAGIDRDCLRDPYFFGILGRSRARPSASDESLKWVQEYAPVSLIVAIPYLQMGESVHSDTVARMAREWLDLAQSSSRGAMLSDAYDILMTIDSNRILALTEGLATDFPVLLARFRNGDAKAGVQWLGQYPLPKFGPSIVDTTFEPLLKEAWRSHRAVLTRDLSAILLGEDVGEETRRGALILAGYFGEASLGEPIKVGWWRAANRRSLLLAGLWAGLRCATGDPPNILDPMMNELTEVPDATGAHGTSERQALLANLRFAARHGYEEAVLRYLVSLADRSPEHRLIATSLLEDIDHPIAVGFVARQLADVSHRATQSGGFSPYALTWSGRWDLETGYKRLSTDSLLELRSIWEAKHNHDWQRRFALSIWATAADDASAIRSIESTDPIFQTAVWYRAHHGDLEVVPEIVELVKAHPHWLQIVSRVWTDDFAPIVDSALASLNTKPELYQDPWGNEQHFLAELLRDIPTEVSERLLVKHWSGLKTVPMFIQAAIYVGTESCRAIAADALREDDLGAEPFRLLGSFFGFMEIHLRKRLSIRHLAALLPYLSRLEDSTLSAMTTFCRRFGDWKWAHEHIRPELRHRIRALALEGSKAPPHLLRSTVQWFPTDDELVAELDRIECSVEQTRSGWMRLWWEDSIERGDEPDRLIRILERWLRNSPTAARMKIVALGLRDRGRRKDLTIIQRYVSAVGEQDLATVLTDTEYAVMRRTLE